MNDPYETQEQIMRLAKALRFADAFTDKAYDPRKSVREAWQRAADKHGEQYANDIFPDGKPELANEGNSTDD